jgi:hypothetical protein
MQKAFYLIFKKERKIKKNKGVAILKKKKKKQCK